CACRWRRAAPAPTDRSCCRRASTARSSRPASECSAASGRASSNSLRRSCGLLQFLELHRIVRMPPAAIDDDALGKDALVAGHVLADHVDVIELAFLHGEDRGVAGAARLEAA